MKIVATQADGLIQLWVTNDNETVRVFVAQAPNLPDAKLAARGQIVRMQTAMERLRSADVQELG